MENKDLINWGDVRITLGGKEIKPIVCCDIAVAGSDYSSTGVIIDNKIHSYTGTITLSKKDIRKLQKALKADMPKKYRLPRKLKKKLKKEREKRYNEIYNNALEWIKYYFPKASKSKTSKYTATLTHLKLLNELDKEISRFIYRNY